MLQKNKYKKLCYCAVAVAAFAVGTPMAQAEDTLFMPSLTNRTGPFAGSGVPFANGYADYFNMLNERDGGIGGAKIIIEECETADNTQKGLECYEATKNKGALAYSPLSTDLTLALIPKAQVDEIPIFALGSGPSVAAIGEKFPWTFVYPTSYWNQMSSILKYIDTNGGVKGKKIGFLYLNDVYGKELLPLLENLSASMGFELAKYPIRAEQVQNQSAQWLNIRKDRPSWVVMWGWGAMNPIAIKQAVKNRYPLDRFIGNGWSGSHNDLKAIGKSGKGYLAANFSGIGQDFPAVEDILKHVVEKGNSQVSSPDDVGNVLYNRGVLNAVVIAEAIAIAQAKTGTAEITGADMRVGLENINLDDARLKELGLEGFTDGIKGSCSDHEGAGSVFMQQWNGEDWEKVSDSIEPMNDIVRLLLEEAAEKVVSDNPGFADQTCG